MFIVTAPEIVTPLIGSETQPLKTLLSSCVWLVGGVTGPLTVETTADLDRAPRVILRNCVVSDPTLTSAVRLRTKNDVPLAGATVKALALVAVPTAVVTEMSPVVAPEGTVAVIWVAELIAKVAPRPLNLTEVVPVKFVPVITTLLPTVPPVGENVVIVGGAVTAKLTALVAVPPGVVTASGPAVAPAGTVVVIWVAELTVKVALTPLKLTRVAPEKLVPVTTTLAPTGPLVGEKLVIVGAGTTVKLLALVAVPPGVVTVMGPVVAAPGAVAVI